MNLQLTPEQARAQLAGLQKQKNVVDKSIAMLAGAGQRLVDHWGNPPSTDDCTVRAVCLAMSDIIAVQILGLSLQQEQLAASIANIENALRGSGIVLPTFLGPERKG
jgi:hypothetical protein